MKMLELDGPHCVDLRDEYGDTLLHLACAEGHSEIANELINDHDAKLDAM